MSDPPRLLDDPSQLTDEERHLLSAGAEMAPPPSLGGDVWAVLAGKLPLAGSGGAAGPGPGGGSALASGATSGANVSGVSALLLKAALLVIAVGALVMGGRLLLHNAAPSAVQKPVASALPEVAPLPVISASAAAVSDSPALVAQLVSALPPRVPSAAHSSKALGSRSVSAPSVSASDASEESRAVAAARDALHAGNGSAALSLLAQAQQRFGNGVLGQEREALSIEALAKSGQPTVARARGEAFLKSYAHSPYAARIRALIGSN